ncbi:MAG: hypothetical protein ACYCOU_19080 [Sulfobacillus sp.]
MLKLSVLVMLFGCATAYGQQRPLLPQSQRPPQTKGQSARQQAAPEQRGTDQLPLTVKIIPTPQSQTEIEREQQQRDEQTRDERKLTNFTGLLVGVGFLQFTAVAVQAVFLYLAFRESKNASDAANRSAKAAEDSLTKLQRAFVALNAIKYLSHVGPDSSVWWSFHFSWRNAGNSRARNVRTFIAKYFEKEDMPRDFPFAITAEPIETHIPPHAEIWAELPVTSEELVAAATGESFLYLWGRAEYRDVFDDTQRYVTRFLVKVSGFRGDVTKPWHDKTNIVEILIPQAPWHNDAT